MKRPTTAVILALGVIAAAFGVWLPAQRNSARSVALQQRYSDVSLLLDAFFRASSSNFAPQFVDLVRILEQRKEPLHNPIPKDPARPCYRLVRTGTAAPLSTLPNEVLIEETDNVNDPAVRIRGYADGSIRVNPK